MRDVVLIGHSQAGTTTPHIIARRPDLFSRLVYVSCIAPEPGARMSETFAQIHGGRHTELAGTVGNPDLTPLDQARLMFCNDMSDEEGDVFLTRLMKDRWPESSRTYADWRYDHLEGIASSYIICLQDRALPGRDRRLAYRIERSVNLFGFHIVDWNSGRIGTAGQFRRVAFSCGNQAQQFVRSLLLRRDTAPKRIGIAYSSLTSSM